ncbi:MAG: 4-hydroxy-tetrahydrodipicolinate synthase [Clostridia bacterium]|nr:4-hydroxy-tetrahydrodipicolinate synthase [Clostridia bacterium]
MKKQLFEGVATAIVTPFKDGKVDIVAFERLVERQTEAGVSAIVVGGTTGEGSTLSEDEKIQLMTVCKRVVKNKKKVIFSVCSNDTLHAVTLAKIAVEKGADGLLVLTPFYNKCADNGLIAHFFAIADAVDKPIVVYNVPNRTGVNVSYKTYKKLSEKKNIVAVKEADGNFSKLVRSIKASGDKLFFYSGNDDTFPQFIAAGGRGVVSVLSNVCPKIVKRICDLSMHGEFERANAYQRKVLPLIDLLFSEVNPIPVKYALYKLGLCENLLRLPLTPLDKKFRKKLDKELDFVCGLEGGLL